MEEYPKIGIKDVALVNVCLRIEDKLFNNGQVILDIETYDFAGRLTNDVIIGLYDGKKYTIYYYYQNYEFEDLEGSDDDVCEISEDDEVFENSEDEIEEVEMQFEYQEYKIEMEADFKRNALPDDFINRIIFCKNSNITISFDGLESNFENIKNQLERNIDLFEQRY